MQGQEESSAAQPDLRVYFAVERTVLAYVRTGLAMMGIGFVVARFGLMLRMLRASAGAAGSPVQTGHSLWLGTALVLLGSAVTMLAAWQYDHQVKRINKMQGQALPRLMAGHGHRLASWRDRDRNGDLPG